MKKFAIVTGGSRGIGFATVKKLLADDYKVLTISRNKNEADKEFLEMTNSNKDLIYLTGDIIENEVRKKIVDIAMENTQRIDLLVNVAGVAPKVRTDILEVSEESWDYVMGVNLKATMFLNQAVANIMKKQELKDGVRGIIINTGSLSSYVSSSNRVEYCASKAGVSMLTKVYAERLAEDSIFVYEVRPGVIDTHMTKVVHEKYTNLIKRGEFPIARWGYPEDVAGAISLLAQGKLLYSTGEIINVDGGYHIRRM